MAVPNFEDKNGNVEKANFVGVPNVQVVGENSEHDTALLKFVWTPKALIRINGKDIGAVPEIAKLKSGRPIDGERVVIPGYPLSSPSLVTTIGIIASSWTDSESFKTTGVSLGAYNGDVYLVDAVVNAGNSGGPVYSIDSKSVVGICDAYLPEPGGAYTVAVPIKYAAELLGNL